MARLVIFRGRRKEGSLELVDREYTLGRAEDADIRIENPLVSRRHAIICYRDHAWRIEDLGTPNGLYVNGGRIEGHSLVPGDHIEIGQHVLIFQGSGDEWFDIETQPGFSRPADGLSDSPTTVLPAVQLQSLQNRVRERMGCHLAMQHDGLRADFPLDAATHHLGFDDECDIRLPGTTMFGKKTAELVRKSADEYAIVSLSSLAPVRVNGEKVSTRLLHDRDRIDVKGFTLTYFRNIH